RDRIFCRRLFLQNAQTKFGNQSLPVTPRLRRYNFRHVGGKTMDFFRQRSAAGTKPEVAPASFYRPPPDTGRVDQVVREVIAKKQGRRADPAFPAVPSFYTWRREQNLSHFSHRILRDVRRWQLALQKLAGLNNELRRAFDLRSHYTL